MQCTNPLSLPELPMDIPCGKCRSCRVSRSREWAVRMMHEVMSHKGSVFLTLTYSDDERPSNESVDKEELQRFVKRLRKRFSDRKLKYFASAEYGEIHGREHYHLILFGLTWDDLHPYKDKGEWRSYTIDKLWKYGLNGIGSVTYDSARYVADYLQKDDRGEVYCTENNLYRTPPFSLKSNGLGKEYAIDHIDQIASNLDIKMRGESVGIPRYYKKKITDVPYFEEGFKEALTEKAKERNHETDVKYLEVALRDNKAVQQVRKESRLQSDKNIKARLTLKDKGNL